MNRSTINPDHPVNKAVVGGGPGLYVATFVLQRPGHPLVADGEIKMAEFLQGDSHLAIAPPAFRHPDGVFDQIVLQTATPEGAMTFLGHPNANGFLSKLVSEPFHAMNHQDAKRKSQSAVSTTLSNISLHLDAPLTIYQVEVVEVSSQNRPLQYSRERLSRS